MTSVDKLNQIPPLTGQPARMQEGCVFSNTGGERMAGELPQARGAWKQKHRAGDSKTKAAMGWHPLNLHIPVALVAQDT